MYIDTARLIQASVMTYQILRLLRMLLRVTPTCTLHATCMYDVRSCLLGSIPTLVHIRFALVHGDPVRHFVVTFLVSVAHACKGIIMRRLPQLTCNMHVETCSMHVEIYMHVET